jgi:hypothetical protein
VPSELERLADDIASGLTFSSQTRAEADAEVAELVAAVRADERTHLRDLVRTAVMAALLASEGPHPPTIRFVAPLALLDTWTTEEVARRLEVPEDLVPGHVRHRLFPIPVRGPSVPVEGREDGAVELGTTVGMIHRLVHVPETDDLLAWGRILDNARGRDLARRMAAGELFLELDVDDVPDSGVSHRTVAGCMVPPGRPVPDGQEATGLSFGSWRVTGAVLGTNPFWALAPALVVDR